jgi:hypothetical protein
LLPTRQPSTSKLFFWILTLGRVIVLFPLLCLRRKNTWHPTWRILLLFWVTIPPWSLIGQDIIDFTQNNFMLNHPTCQNCSHLVKIPICLIKKKP